jgi:hypothetical protein
MNLTTISPNITMLTPIDQQLVNRINKNDRSAWKELYNRYASIMMGAISIFTRDDAMAEKILEDLFVGLSKKKSIDTGSQKMSLYLYIESFEHTVKTLRAKGITPCVQNLAGYPAIIQQLCKCHAVKEIPPAERITSEDLRTGTSRFCWLPIFGVNPYANALRAIPAI